MGTCEEIWFLAFGRRKRVQEMPAEGLTHDCGRLVHWNFAPNIAQELLLGLSFAGALAGIAFVNISLFFVSGALQDRFGLVLQTAQFGWTDVAVLVAWTVIDPLEWERVNVSVDKFGAPLESEGKSATGLVLQLGQHSADQLLAGYCTSESWKTFSGIIGTLHLCLLGVACYLCYRARDIPTKFSEGKYVSIGESTSLPRFAQSDGHQDLANMNHLLLVFSNGLQSSNL